MKPSLSLSELRGSCFGCRNALLGNGIELIGLLGRILKLILVPYPVVPSS